ncbi:MAG: phosphatase family protein [Sphingobacteriaceae bacterium]|jgi:undecaprenyl-diphosphatase|nr:phosphatase family protein [Sphingobacteriaceae bacterium]
MKRRKYIYLLTLIGIVAGFVLLSLFVYYFPESPLDIEFSEEVQEHRNPFMDALMRLVSWFGYMPWSAAIAVATAIIFFILRYKKEGLFILLTLLSGLVSSGLKLLINRPRPTDDLVEILEKAKHQSFPSGHVIFYVTFFGMLFLIMRHHHNFYKPVRWIVMSICIFLIFVVPLSRVYLGAHWFTDVTAGFIAGLFCLALLGYFYLVKKAPAMASGQQP